MAKYRRKPIIVEAEQWFPGKKAKGALISYRDRCYVITAHNQLVFIEPGDYIIPEPDGIHYYPVKPDIFESTYEKVEE